MASQIGPIQWGSWKILGPFDGSGNPLLSPLTSYAYDAVGNLLEMKDALNHATKYEYDRLFRRTKETDALSKIKTFGYDLVGNMRTLTDPNANTTTWVYDTLDRVHTETIVVPGPQGNENKTRTFRYDAVGNTRELKDRLNRVTTYGYDKLYRQTSETWSAGATRVFTFGYDLIGNMTSADDSLSAAAEDYKFTYDALDRVDLEEQTLSAVSLPSLVLDHDFDLVGNRTQLAATISGATISGSSVINGVKDFKTNYVYDKLYRAISVTQQGQGANAVANKHVTFAYDAASQLTDVKRYAALNPSSNFVAHSRHGYDQAGRLTSITHAKTELPAGTTWNGSFASAPSQTIAAYFLEYDQGNRLDKFSSWSDKFLVDYAYDNRNQLQTATYDDGTGVTAPFLPANESYGYDDNGNRETANGQDFTPAANNQLQSDGTYRFKYDGEGNRVAKFRDFNLDGVLSSGDTDITQYTWDHRNRLTKFTHQATCSPTTVDKAIDYLYDVFDRRVSKTVDPDGNGSQTAYRDLFVYDGPHIALEFRDANTSESTPAALTHRYLHGPSVDMILADEQVTTTSSPGNVLWALTDHLGSTRDLVDASGVVVKHFVYASYGTITSETNPTLSFRFTFTGRERDAETPGLMYYRARYYSTTEGLFISEDPIGFDGDPSNQQRYVENAPTTTTDPMGLRKFTLEIVYFVSDMEITPQVKAEVNRIFLAAVTKYAMKGHTLTIKWTPVSSMQALKDTECGFTGTRFERQGVRVGFHDQLTLGNAAGQAGAGAFRGGLNVSNIRNDTRKSNRPFDIGVATTICHEIGFHGFGGKADHFHDYGYIDASLGGQMGKEFSPEAAKLIIQKLDMDD